MFKPGDIWKCRKHILVDVIALAVVFNLLYFLFFFDREYLPVSITTEVIGTEQTIVWYVYKEKYSEERFYSAKDTLLPDQNYSFEFDIPSNTPIDYIGMYWESAKGSHLMISLFEYSVSSKIYTHKKNREIIDYVSNGSIVEDHKEGVRVTSTDSNRNWIMLNNTDSLNDNRDIKIHNPISVYANLLLIVFLMLFRISEPKKRLTLNSGSIKLGRPFLIENLLSLWGFIMPFWIIISHTFMGIISFVTLVFTFKDRNLGTLFSKLKISYAFFAFYAIVILSSIATSTFSQTIELVGDYSYFVLMPIVFSSIPEKRLPFIFNYVEKGIIAYFLLLIIYATTGYILKDHELSFVNFFELMVEDFWHTSYLSIFILLLFIKYLKTPIKHNYVLLLFYIVGLLFMYLVNARMPLLVGLLLVLFKIIETLNIRRPRRVFLLTVIALGLILMGSFLLKNVQDTWILSKNNVFEMDARLSLWEAGIKQAKENVFFGVGNKKTVDSVVGVMEGNTSTKFRSYNIHNQFIETFLANGLLALVFLITIFYRLFRRGIVYATAFSCCLILLFMVESYFNHQAGIILFTFWSCFFLKYKNDSVEIKE